MRCNIQHATATAAPQLSQNTSFAYSVHKMKPEMKSKMAMAMAMVVQEMLDVTEIIVGSSMACGEMRRGDATRRVQLLSAQRYRIEG